MRKGQFSISGTHHAVGLAFSTLLHPCCAQKLVFWVKTKIPNLCTPCRGPNKLRGGADLSHLIQLLPKCHMSVQQQPCKKMGSISANHIRRDFVHGLPGIEAGQTLSIKQNKRSHGKKGKPNNRKNKSKLGTLPSSDHKPANTAAQNLGVQALSSGACWFHKLQRSDASLDGIGVSWAFGQEVLRRQDWQTEEKLRC